MLYNPNDYDVYMCNYSGQRKCLLRTIFVPEIILYFYTKKRPRMSVSWLRKATSAVY